MIKENNDTIASYKANIDKNICTHICIYTHTHTSQSPENCFSSSFFFLSTDIENCIERERTAETLVHRMSFFFDKYSS